MCFLVVEIFDCFYGKLETFQRSTEILTFFHRNSEISQQQENLGGIKITQISRS